MKSYISLFIGITRTPRLASDFSNRYHPHERIWMDPKKDVLYIFDLLYQGANNVGFCMAVPANLAVEAKNRITHLAIDVCLPSPILRYILWCCEHAY